VRGFGGVTRNGYGGVTLTGYSDRMRKVSRRKMRRLGMRLDDRGDVSLGYILILVICALVMTAMAMISAGFISQSGEVAKETQVEQVKIIIETEMEEAIYMGCNFPGAVYLKNITLPEEIYGVNYRIELTFKFVYINGTHGDIREKVSINPAPGMLLRGSVSSSAGIALIKYNGKGTIEIS